MNGKRLEQRLRDDAARVRSDCPARVRHRVLSRIRTGEPARVRRLPGLPVMAGAFGALLVFVGVWVVRPASDPPSPAASRPDLNAAPIVASSDRLLASREAALQNEWQLLERDLRLLRDHVTATFDKNPNS
jgi:hypothetical protein